MTYRALAGWASTIAELKKQLDSSVNFALQRLYAQQKADGGWGWFVQDDSNPLTTAYALIGLAEAQRRGLSQFDYAWHRAVQFLRRLTRSRIRPQEETWRLNRQAFLLYALARGGSQCPSRAVRALRRARAHEHLRAGLSWRMTFHLIDPRTRARR